MLRREDREIGMDLPIGLVIGVMLLGFDCGSGGAVGTEEDDQAVQVAPGPTTSNPPASTSSTPPTTTTGTSPGAAIPPTPTPSPNPDPNSGPALAWNKANLTNYESYPAPGSEECIANNGCEWEGQFAALDDRMPESWVKANNIISVHSKDFAKYKLKTFRLRQGSKQIDAKVYDKCADSDCDGCCTENSRETGFLIDVEKYTMQRFGSGDGIVEWACIDCQ